MNTNTRSIVSFSANVAFVLVAIVTALAAASSGAAVALIVSALVFWALVQVLVLDLTPAGVEAGPAGAHASPDNVVRFPAASGAEVSGDERQAA